MADEDTLDVEPDDDDLDDDQADDTEDVDAAGLTADEARELEDKLKRANRRARKYRQALEAGRKPAPDEVDPDLAEAIDRGDKAVSVAKRALARAAVLEAGGNPAAVRLMDLDDLDISDDGELEGITDALDEVREVAPEMFRKAADEPARRKAPKRGGGSKTPPEKAPPTATDALVAAFRGDDG